MRKCGNVSKTMSKTHTNSRAKVRRLHDDATRRGLKLLRTPARIVLGGRLEIANNSTVAIRQ